MVDRMYAREKEVGWVCGACMLCRRGALEDAGLMDENFFMYKEDVDLCIGVRRRGWAVRYTPAASILHYRGASVKKRNYDTAVEYRKSQLYFYKKHYGRAGLALLKFYLYAKAVKILLSSFWLRRVRGKNTCELEESDRLNRRVLSVIRDYQ